jgi:hypothetical protein
LEYIYVRPAIGNHTVVGYIFGGEKYLFIVPGLFIFVIKEKWNYYIRNIIGTHVSMNN